MTRTTLTTKLKHLISDKSTSQCTDPISEYNMFRRSFCSITLFALFSPSFFFHRSLCSFGHALLAAPSLIVVFSHCFLFIFLILLLLFNFFVFLICFYLWILFSFFNLFILFLFFSVPFMGFPITSQTAQKLARVPPTGPSPCGKQGLASL